MSKISCRAHKISIKYNLFVDLMETNIQCVTSVEVCFHFNSFVLWKYVKEI